MTGGNSDESPKVSKMSPSTKELIKEFCNYTTTHGIGRLAEAKTIFSRFIWTVFICGAFAMFFYQIHGLFELFLSRPVSTIVKVKHKTKVAFPAVVVCNQNPVKLDFIPNDYISDINEEIRKRLHIDSKKDSQNPNLGNSSTDSNDTADEYYDPEQQLRIEYLAEELLIAKLAVENDTTLYAMGHQFNDFVFDCYFRGTDCRNYSNFWSRFWDYRYGNCYEFNGGKDDNDNDQTILKTHSTGPFGGLKLNLFIESLQYVSALSHSAGARITIHDQNSVSFPDEEGINVLPGISTSVGVRREVIKRVDPFNNGSCRKSSDDERMDKPYTREACMRTCLADAQIRECGCADGQYAYENKPICDTLKDPKTDKCLDGVETEYNEGVLDCQTGCPVPCREVVFKTSMSLAEWPSESYKKTLFNRLYNRPNEAYDNQLDDGVEFLNKNFLQVRVFYERLNYQEVTEELNYKAVNLLADIGGQLGLWIGISVLTCCEFLELLLLLGQTAMKRMAAKGSRVEVIST